MAVEPSQCVSRVNIPGGGVGLRNNCDKKINVSFCVENGGSQWACQKGGSNAGRGTYDVAPGKHVAIHNYSSEGGGTIHFVACIHPDAPVNWSLQRNSFACR